MPLVGKETLSVLIGEKENLGREQHKSFATDSPHRRFNRPPDMKATSNCHVVVILLRGKEFMKERFLVSLYMSCHTKSTCIVKAKNLYDLFGCA